MQPLFIIFLQLGIGGVQRKIVDMVNNLENYKPDLPIYILLRNRTEFDLAREITNKNVGILDYSNWLKIRIRYFFPVFIIYQVWKLKPKSILAFLDFCSIPAIVAKYIFFWRKIRVVLSEDHYASQVISGWKLAKLRHLLINIFYPLANVVFTCSQANKKDLVENFQIAPSKIKVIINWTLFTPEKTNVAKKYDLVYVGRLEKTKNLAFLLTAMTKLKKISLMILGEGKEKINLSKLASKLNLKNRVSFIKSSHKVRNYIKKAKIFIYCSETKVEGLPIAILEAMAVGTPVLARYFAGAKEFLKNGENCYLFKNEKEFIKKTAWLLKNNSVRKQISLRAQKYISQKHSSKNMFPYFKELGLINNKIL